MITRVRFSMYSTLPIFNEIDLLDSSYQHVIASRVKKVWILVSWFLRSLTNIIKISQWGQKLLSIQAYVYRLATDGLKCEYM